jgi:ammonium transporter
MPGFGYSIPAHWVWDSRGWLNTRGVVDIAGSGVVHLCGGAAAFVAALLLGPRKGRYDPDSKYKGPGAPTNIILGTFILWWGWLGFNCGSTFGVQNGLWRLAGKSAITTLNASMGGGFAGIVVTLISTRGHFGVGDLCNGVLGGLVSITAPCAVVRPWEAVVIGIIGGLLVVGAQRLIDLMKVDDPVSAVAVHGVGGIWGLLSVGFFMNDEPQSGLNKGHVGLFHGGGGYSLGIQAACAASIIAWSSIFTLIVLSVLKFTIGLRMSEEDEELGADTTEHGVDLFDPRNLIIEKTGANNIQLRRKSAYGHFLEGETNEANIPDEDEESEDAGPPQYKVSSTDSHGLKTVFVVDDQQKTTL